MYKDYIEYRDKNAEAFDEAINEYKTYIEDKSEVFNKRSIDLEKNIENNNTKIDDYERIIHNNKINTNYTKFDNRVGLTCITSFIPCAIIGLIMGSGLVSIAPYIYLGSILSFGALTNLFISRKFRKNKKRLFLKNYPTTEEENYNMIMEYELKKNTLENRIKLDKELMSSLGSIQDKIKFKKQKDELNEESNGFININSRDINKEIYSLEAEIEKNKRLLDKKSNIDYLKQLLEFDLSKRKMILDSIAKVGAILFMVVFISAIGGLSIPPILSSVVIANLFKIGGFLGLLEGVLNYKFLRTRLKSVLKTCKEYGLEVSKGKIINYSELTKELDEDKVKKEIFDLESKLMEQKIELVKVTRKEQESLKRREKERQFDKREDNAISYSMMYDDTLESGPTLKKKM